MSVEVGVGNPELGVAIVWGKWRARDRGWEAGESARKDCSMVEGEELD